MSKMIIGSERTANIIRNAIRIGYRPNETDVYEDVSQEAERYLIDNSHQRIGVYCSVKKGVHLPYRIEYKDEMGFESWGEYGYISSEIMSSVVNSKGEVVDLYARGGKPRG